MSAASAGVDKGTGGSGAGGTGAQGDANKGGAGAGAGAGGGDGGTGGKAGSKDAGGGDASKGKAEGDQPKDHLGDDAPADGDGKGKKEEQGAQGDKSKDGKSADAGELKITLPEGVTADPKLLGEFTNFAKEHKFTSEQASALAAWDFKRQQAAQASADQAWKAQGEAWRKEFDTDPDYGGDKLKQSVLEAKRPLRNVKGGDQVVALLRETGQANHPVIMRWLVELGRGMKEDSTGASKRTQAGGPMSKTEFLDLLYDHPSSNRKAG